MRIFIGMFLDNNICSKIEELIDYIKEKIDIDAKWVEIKNMHITLKFLGEVKQDLLHKIYSTVSDVLLGIRSFNLSLSRVGVFPSLYSPRVVWIGLDRGREEVVSISEKLNSALLSLGFKKEEIPYSPHITLCRLRSQKNKEKLLQLISQIEPLNLMTKIKSVSIVKSQLTPAGPIYSIIKNINFS